MLNKPLTLTIVIPVYNEEGYLAACLNSIAEQAVMPDEVIVVDNNSTDQTVAIAKSFPFVRVLHEPRQHQSFAQRAGFNAARGDIIGRIDADTVLSINWCKKVKEYFAINQEIVGITGSTTPYDVSIGSIGTAVFKFYIDLASRLAGTRLLWGANCAIRRSDWLKVRGRVMTRGDIWEDYDLSFCLANFGRLRFAEDMVVGSSFRAVSRGLITQTRYQFRAVRTFYYNRSLAKTAVFMSVWCSLYLMFIPVSLDKYVLKPLQSLFTTGRQPRKTTAEVVQFEVE